jgi:hypothetical protein
VTYFGNSSGYPPVRALLGTNPTQALCLGMLACRELPGPLGMLPGLGGQRPTPLGDALLHARDLQLDLGNRLGQLDNLLPQRVALRPRLPGANEQVRPAGSGSAIVEPTYPPTCDAKSPQLLRVRPARPRGVRRRGRGRPEEHGEVRSGPGRSELGGRDHMIIQGPRSSRSHTWLREPYRSLRRGAVRRGHRPGSAYRQLLGPHLHFQLMDSADPVQAKGNPCAFAEYLVQRDGDWERVQRGVPGRHERIRSMLEGSTQSRS